MRFRFSRFAEIDIQSIGDHKSLGLTATMSSLGPLSFFVAEFIFEPPPPRPRSLRRRQKKRPHPDFFP